MNEKIQSNQKVQLDKTKHADVVACLDFDKALDTISHSIVPEKLAACGLDGCAVH